MHFSSAGGVGIEAIKVSKVGLPSLRAGHPRLPAQVFACGRWACVCHFSRLQFLNDPRSYPGAATRLSSTRMWSRLVRRRCVAAASDSVVCMCRVDGAFSGGSRPVGQSRAPLVFHMSLTGMRCALCFCVYTGRPERLPAGQGPQVCRLPLRRIRAAGQGGQGHRARLAARLGGCCLVARLTLHCGTGGTVRSAARAPGERVFAPCRACCACCAR